MSFSLAISIHICFSPSSYTYELKIGHYSEQLEDLSQKSKQTQIFWAIRSRLTEMLGCATLIINSFNYTSNDVYLWIFPFTLLFFVTCNEQITDICKDCADFSFPHSRLVNEFLYSILHQCKKRQFRFVCTLITKNIFYINIAHALCRFCVRVY